MHKEPASSPTYAPLELLPVAGLANRLRAMASAICAAQDTGRPLTILWQQQYSICRGRARQLFDLSAVALTDIGFGGPPPYPHRECLSPADWQRFKERDPYKPIYMKSYGHFHQSDPVRWVAALRSLRPHPAIRDRVDTLFADWEAAAGAPLVGVHIRRTDHRKAIQLSPTVAFFERMRAYPPTTHFFLATDDALERDLLVQAFPGRVHFGATTLNRDSEEGGVQAFTDLLCLARCREILGSAGSSFSEVAAAWGGCPLHLILSVS
jgi:hypothetical protein